MAKNAGKARKEFNEKFCIKISQILKAFFI